MEITYRVLSLEKPCNRGVQLKHVAMTALKRAMIVAFSRFEGGWVKYLATRRAAQEHQQGLLATAIWPLRFVVQ